MTVNEFVAGPWQHRRTDPLIDGGNHAGAARFTPGIQCTNIDDAIDRRGSRYRGPPCFLAVTVGANFMAQILSPGTVAPSFTLRVTPDQTLSLEELRGKAVILAFYPADWSPVCGDQMTLYNQVLPMFHK